MLIRKPLVGVALLVLLLVAQPVDGQELFGQKLFGRKMEVQLVPDSAFASGVLFPKQVAEDPSLDLFPREVVTAWGRKEFGFDPMMLRQLTFVLRAQENFSQAPEWCAILHFDEVQGLAGGLIGRLEQRQISGKTLYSGQALGLPSFLIVDESTILAGDEPMFAEMLASTGNGPLAQMMKRGSIEGQALGFMDISTVKPQLEKVLASMPTMLPPAITKLKRLPELVTGIELGLEIKGKIATELRLHCVDDDQADVARKILEDAIDLGKDLMIGTMATQFDLEDPVQAATLEYIQRMGSDYQDRISPKLNGSSLAVQVDNDAAVVPIMIGMLLPAVQQVRSAARRTQSMNNSRQVSLALHNYQSVYNKFPAQANYDKNGRPLLSWRVHILPFIDQQELYDQFHLDEPWDSPHNRALISRMPMIYQSPSTAAAEGKTVYLGISGPNSFFSDQPRDFSDITDGSSNTAWLVEANSDMAVEWTKPQDYEVDPNRPKRGLGGVNPGLIMVALADGSVQMIDSSIDVDAWKGLLTINGGEVNDIR